jgi:hypothetical protein
MFSLDSPFRWLTCLRNSTIDRLILRSRFSVLSS